MLILSRQNNLTNTGIEAYVYSSSVVAINIDRLTDIVDVKSIVYIAKKFGWETLLAVLFGT
tara:strand:- start:2630 stop:2812 length:183 start_codon:yes stop_codon:yes gene_type:complete